MAYTVNRLNTPTRIRILSPIRDFILGNKLFHTPQHLQEALAELYFELMVDHADSTQNINRTLVTSESLNLLALFKRAHQMNLECKHLVDASIEHAKWMSYFGTWSLQMVEWVLQRHSISDK